MKIKLVIEENGNVIFEGKHINKKDINSCFLEKIFRKSLKEEIDFVIDETDPISQLFIRIENETKKGSNYYNEIVKLRSELEEGINEKKSIESSKSEEDLPF